MVLLQCYRPQASTRNEVDTLQEFEPDRPTGTFSQAIPSEVNGIAQKNELRPYCIRTFVLNRYVEEPKQYSP